MTTPNPSTPTSPAQNMHRTQVAAQRDAVVVGLAVRTVGEVGVARMRAVVDDGDRILLVVLVAVDHRSVADPMRTVRPSGIWSRASTWVV